MRVLLLAVAAVVLGAVGAAAALSISDSSLARSGSTTSTLPSVAPARTTEDVSGPCDEAEHANDARCTGTATTTQRDANRREDRAGHRHRERHGRDEGGARGTVDNGGRGSSGAGGGSGDDSSGSSHGGGNSGPGGGGDDGGGHSGGGSSGHGGGGGRDHPEDD